MDLVGATGEAIRAVACGMRSRDQEEFSAVLPVESRDELAAWLRATYQHTPGLLCAGERGEPICIGGAVSIRPGSATLLMFATDAFPRIAKPLTRFIRRTYFPSLAAAGVHRVEAVSLADYREMHRWLKTLGLRKEGEFPAYGRRRETFVQYGRVF